MSSIYDVDFRLGNVAAIRLRLRGVERRLILAPDHQQTWLLLAHPSVPLGVSVHVGAVVVEEVALNVALAGLIEKIIFVGPEIGVMAFDVGIVADVTRARG